MVFTFWIFQILCGFPPFANPILLEPSFGLQWRRLKISLSRMNS